MIFIWGRQKVERRMGWVADYCPVCRSVRPFRLTRVGIASHVFFISASAGDLIGFVGECKDCGASREVDGTQYQTIEKKLPAELQQLIQLTHPTIHAGMVGGPLSENAQAKAAREQALLEPFKAISPMVEARFGEKSGKFDFESGMGCLSSVVLAVSFLLVVMMMNMTTLRQFLVYTLLLLIPVAAIYTVVQMCLVSRRFVARKVLPPLANALRPLNPTRDELATCLARLKNLNSKIAQKVDADSLWAEIKSGSRD
jgi:hypothetical protein